MINQRFRLEIKNTSDVDVNAILFNIGTSGSIRLLSPRGAAFHIPAKKSYTTNSGYREGGPIGLETFMVIAYMADGKVPPDFSVLEQPGVVSNQTKALESPLSWLAALAVVGSKDPVLVPSLTLSTWTTDLIDVSIRAGQ